MNERRRHVRIKPDAICLSFRVGDRTVRAPVIDLSTAGALAATRETLWRGTYVECDVEIDDSRRITLAGFVLDDTTRREGLVLSFLPPGHATATALADIVERVAAARASRRDTA